MQHPGPCSAMNPALCRTGAEGGCHIFGSANHLVGLLVECVRSEDS